MHRLSPRLLLLALALLVLAVGCGKDGKGGAADGGADGDVDGDTDTDVDSDSTTDTDSEPQECSDEDPFDQEDCPTVGFPDPCLYYVDVDATGSGDGQAWSSAFSTVQEGIDAAHCAALDVGGCQVWVAEGIYPIYQGCREDAVRLRSGVEVYGGFTGSESSISERDWVENETILYGKNEEISNKRIYHVVIGSDDAVLDGFTVERGNANGPEPHDRGGGLFNFGVSPTVTNCTFRDNDSDNFGGGIYNDMSAAVVQDSFFIYGNSRFGGAIANVNGSSVTISGCRIEQNGADTDGGGVWVGDSAADVQRCEFFRNGAGFWGGGFAAEQSVVALVNSVVLDNSSGHSRGGASFEECTVTVNHINVIGNDAEYGPDGAEFKDCSGTVTNSIFWGNGIDSNLTHCCYDDEILVTYSNVGGGEPGAGNIDADPLSEWVGDQHRIGAGSPCIDAANGTVAPATDINGNPRVDALWADNIGIGPPWADMGAHEYNGPPPETEPDAGPDVGSDAGTDAGVDAGPDAAPDGGK